MGLIQRFIIFALVLYTALAPLDLCRAEDDHGRRTLTGQPRAKPGELKGATKDKADAVLLLDASGSMRLTDPDRLRDEGAKLFIEFLKPGDRVAVIEFSDKAKVISPFVEYSRERAEELAESVSVVGNAGLYTDLLAGLQAAYELLKASGRPDANQTIILLSDGKMEPNPETGTAADQTSRLLDEFLPELKANGIKTHTLAFSDEADRDLLAQVAVATDGIHWFTSSSEEIHESYAELFVVVKKPQIVPLTKEGFPIDADVKEATFYINNAGEGEVGVMSPSGVKITKGSSNSNVRWFSGKKFEVVTVVSPEVGHWQVIGLSKNEGFATVLTDLKLVTDWPASVDPGQTELLQVRLYESEKPVVLPEMTGTIKYAFQITPTDRVSEPIIRELLEDQGEHGDRRARDGIFSTEVMLEEPGDYRLRVLARAPTFERHQEVLFRVRAPLIILELVNREVAVAPVGAADHAEHGAGEESHGGHGKDEHHGEKHGDPQASEHGQGESDLHEDSAEHHGGKTVLRDFFRVKLNPELASLQGLEVKLIAVDLQRNRYALPLEQARNQLRFFSPVTSLPKDGSYEVQARFKGQSRARGMMSGESDILNYTRTTVITKGEEEAIPLEMPADHVPENLPEPDPSYVLHIILVIVLNTLIGVFMLFTLRKSQGAIAVSAEGYQVPPDLLESIGMLEERAAVEVVEEGDPLLDVVDEEAGSEEGSDLEAALEASQEGESTEEPTEEGAEAAGEESSAGEGEAPTGEEQPAEAEVAPEEAEPAQEEEAAEEPEAETEDKPEE